MQSKTETTDRRGSPSQTKLSMTFVKKIVLTLTLLISAEFLLTGTQQSSLAATFYGDRQVTQLNTISPYDMLFISAADSTKWDWKLLAAMAHTESRFTPDARSHRGATGLMQIMPRTAKYQGFDAEVLTDPKSSIEIAIKILDSIEGSFRFPKNLLEREKLSVILAAYNAGTGYVINARRSAHQDGAAYNSWNTLSTYITIRGTHSETVNYVAKVLRTYDKYKAHS